MLALLLALLAIPAHAQRRALTSADYARAESFLFYRTNPLIFHAAVQPNWLPDGRFWYRDATPTGAEFIVVDPATGARAPFAAPAAAPPAVFTEVLSPDKKRAAFVRGFNLWVRDVATGAETQLTTDGVQDFAYATDNAGWTRSEHPVVLWSPDSAKIATFQQDQRGVGEMYLVDTRVGHPRLLAWKYPMAGDEVVITIQRVVIHLGGPRVVRLKMPPDQHRSTYYDDLARRGEWGDVQWKADATELAFVSTSRDHKIQNLRVADAGTGAVREVLEERSDTFLGSAGGQLNWKYLPASREAIWYSERDNWGQLYLYDLDTGKLKNRITTGKGNVAQLLRVDEKARLAWFLGAGKETGRDPYLRHLYRAPLDGGAATLLTPEDADHQVSISPDGRYLVDAYSRPEVPPVSVLRTTSGQLIATLQRAEISRLQAAGWKPPIPITVKARDGVTPLYGLMYQPTNLDRAKKYPIVNHIYPGGSVGPRSFLASRADSQAMAELGFIVVEIDGMGTPGRSKSFFDFAYGNLGDATLPDQIAAMKELAARYPWIDIDRAGIHGHSGGGYGTADAMFRYPDFFKVGVAQAGDHDNRAYEDDWVELAQGLLKRNPDGTSSYDNQANQLLAGNLKGHLLLAHGSMDTNVSPYNTLLVVNALIQANKDFDLLLLPNRNHGFSNEPYMTRRRWDYFVRYLLDADPPAGYELHPPG